MSDDAPKVVSIGKSEAAIAADLKERAAVALKPLLAVMSEAMGHGMTVQFDNIGMDAFGRFQANGLRVVKVYA